MIKAGTAYVDIDGDLSSLHRTIDGALGGITGKFGKVGTAAAAGLGAIAVAGVGAGKALYDIGASFDDAYDTIRVGTGKTGKELDGLKGTFKDVVKSVPTDFGSAATAITQVSDRLGLTGKPLKNLSSQFLELSRITGTDLQTNITTVTRVFGDWSIKTKDQARSMDELFRASQKTGVPVDQLGQLIVKYGAPLRQLGFSFEESAAMVGKFEKEGVNTQLVMGSMRVALGKMAKAGEDPQKTFQRITTEIKNAGSAGEANKLALELFGARAGPDMAAAIREGRFELGNLTKQISGGKDTIIGAGKDTQDFSEKWLMFKNRVLVGLEPLATGVFNAIGTAMDKLPAIADDVLAAFEDVKAAFTGTGDGADELKGVLDDLSDAFDGFVDTATVIWDKFGDDILNILRGLAENIRTQAKAMIQVLQGVVDFVAGVFTGDWGRAWDGIKEIFGGFAESLKGNVTATWTAIKALFSASLTAIGGIFSAAWDTMKNVASSATSAIAGVLSTAWNGIKTTAGTAWDAIRDAVLTPIRAARDFLPDIATGMLNRLVSGFTSIKNAASDAWDAIKDAVLVPIRAARDALPDVMTGMVNRVASGWSRILGGVADFAGDVVSKISGAFKGAANMVIGFVNKIIDAINFIPGIPNIGHIARLAEGGKVSSNIGDIPYYAQGGALQGMRTGPGGKVTRPLAIVGEEAPRHPEFVIPTNPAYRGRALGLYGQLSKDLGIPGFGLGGLIGGGLSKIGDIASAAFDLVKQGAGFFLNKLPGIGDLPTWLKGLGSYALHSVTGWIKDKVSGLLGGGGSDPLSRITSMVKTMDDINARHYPYVYGGGHGGFGGPYDCSGLVSAILHAGGFLGSPITTDGLKVFGESGVGDAITIGVRGSTGANAHTMMKLGNRYLESGGGHGAAWTSGWDGSFPIMRHPAGYAKGGILTSVLEELFDPKNVGWGLAQGGLVGHPFVGSYKDGGIVPRDGFAFVHQGETVSPAGGTERFQFFLDGKEIDVRVERIVDERDRVDAHAYRAGV